MSDKYYTTTKDIVYDIEENGLAIIPNFLDDEECEAMREGFFSTFEYITDNRFDRNDKKTWRELKDLMPVQGMLFQNYGIGQAQVSWDLRQKEKLINVFKDLYDDDDLTVSMDGVSFSLPPEVTNCGWFQGRDNTHVDQSLFDNERNWFQGFISANEVREGDATFSFIPKSHLKHKEFREYKENGGACGHKPDDDPLDCEECVSFRKYKGGKDWYVLTDKDLEYLGELERVKCPQGSLVIWDSRLFHSGSRPKRGRKEENIRMVSYITYYPKKRLTEKQKKYHLATFKLKETSTHHFQSRFQVYPRTYGMRLKKVNLLPEPKLDNVGKKLLDFNFYDNVGEFVKFCRIHGRYPTKSDNSDLSKWFTNEKKKCRDVNSVYTDIRIHDLFKEKDWWMYKKPELRNRLNEFIKFCNKHKRCPEETDDAVLARWFENEKAERCKGNFVIDTSLDDLFREDEWWLCDEPELR